MMSYQIKSTPFVRRIVSTSKQNGQLQKLKDEYERIKEFNDYALEMRMKQVRLKRLYQEIEEIKENEIRKRRMIQERAREKAALQEQNKNSVHEQRIQDFMRTQTIKKNFSTQSLTRPPRREQKPTRAKAGANNVNVIAFIKGQKQLEADNECKARMLRRLNYGNQISSWNMQKMLTTNLNREVSDTYYKKRCKATISPKKLQNGSNKGGNESDKPFSQKERQKYANKQQSYAKSPKSQQVKSSQSSTTAKYSTQHQKTGNVTHQKYNQKKKTTNVKITQPLEMSSSEQLIRVENSGSYSTDDCESSQEEKVVTENEMEPSANARRLWRKLALMLRKRQGNESFYKAIETLQKCSSDLEYQLRSISNVTNLSKSIIPLRGNYKPTADNEDSTDSDATLNDTFVNSQKYILDFMNPNRPTLKASDSIHLDTIPSTSVASATVLAEQPTLPKSVEKNDDCEKATFVLSSLTAEALNEQVQTMINKYLPFSMDAVKAEIADYSSKRLRQVFEEQYKLN